MRRRPVSYTHLDVYKRQVDNLIAELDRTEANTLVIDLKDDFGRVACEMESPLVQELGSSKAVSYTHLFDTYSENSCSSFIDSIEINDRFLCEIRLFK